MTIIGADLYGTTTLGCMTSATNSITDDQNAASTTALGVASSISSAISSEHMYMGSTRYVESLSDEQLEEYVRVIEHRENEMFSQFKEETTKVKTYKNNL